MCQASHYELYSIAPKIIPAGIILQNRCGVAAAAEVAVVKTLTEAVAPPEVSVLDAGIPVLSTAEVIVTEPLVSEAEFNVDVAPVEALALVLTAAPGTVV